MLRYKLCTNGHPISRYFRSLIENAPLGVVIDVYSFLQASPTLEFYEVWFDELEAWPDEKT